MYLATRDGGRRGLAGAMPPPPKFTKKKIKGKKKNNLKNKNI
jgi:hypothetical protein